jgi:hypothetical protein
MPYLDPEDLANMYLRNFGSTANSHTVQATKRRINIINESPWNPKINNFIIYLSYGARGSVVGRGTIIQAEVAGSSPGWMDFFNLPNPSSRIMSLGSTQPLTEMSTRNLAGGKKRPERKADNLAAICEPNVWKYGSLNFSQP